jgi:4-amino-4-deoxy-L-arabinose transferase-like glycosyltransferase
MTYHLARAAWWLQRGGFHYVSEAHTQRENAFQPNAELEVLWSFALLHRDTVAALPQWLAGLAGCASVYGMARRVGFAAAASAFAALLTATLSQVALQSVTTQNDLLAASFVAAAACLLLERSRTGAALAGLAVALALGTKLTSAFALPLLLALAAVSLPRRRLAEWAGAAVAAFVLVGLYGYALNLANTGHVLGDPSAYEALQPSPVTATGTISTVARIGFRFVDLPGYHAQPAVADALGDAGRAVFDALHVPTDPPESASVPFDFAVGLEPNEDLSFFGPLGALLVLPLSLGFVVAGIARRTSPQRLVLALAVPVYAVEVSLAYSYNVWIGRFMIAPVLLTMPLAAWIAGSRLAAGAAAVVGALTLALTHAYNLDARPTGLDGSGAVWSLPRAQAQTVPQPALAEVVAGVDRAVPPDARLGTVIGPDDWEYPLFGPRLGRRLVPLPEGDALVPAAERAGVRFVVLNDRARRPSSSPGWSRVDFPEAHWSLLARTG